MSPAGLLLLAASLLLDLPSALVRLAAVAVLLGLGGKLDARADALALAIAFGPYLRSLAAVALPVPAGPVLRATTGARRPSERERTALANAFALVRGSDPPRSVLVLDSPDENAWVIGSTLFVSRGLFESPHLAPVVAHEAGHLARRDGQVALAAWWLPVRSLAWGAQRLLGRPRGRLPEAGRTLPQPRAVPEPAPLRRPGRRTGLVGRVLRLPAVLLGFGLLVMAGGLFPMLLRPLWAAYRRGRELAADAFAAGAGLGPGLVDALADWQVLDLATPWWQGRSHPYVEQRIDRLRRHAL